MIDAGATTIWERWDGWTSERGFQFAWMNSFNRYSVGEWLYRFVLGIDQEPGTDGFGRLLVRPHPGGTLTWARGSYQSVRVPVGARTSRCAARSPAAGSGTAAGSPSGSSCRRTSPPASGSQ
jgi:hypothetical protein